jgi:hypothetical protein
VAGNRSGKQVVAASILRYLLNLVPLLGLLFLAVPGHGSSYHWTDREGTLHFSDTLPPGPVPQETLDLTDPGQRPLLVTKPPVYQDKVMRLSVVAEREDHLEFELEYTAIHHAYPEIIKGGAFVWLCAVDSSRSPTGLAWVGANLEGGDGRVKLVNTLSKQSPPKLATDGLILTVQRRDRAQGVDQTLGRTEIPFRKNWEKQSGVTYR